MEKQRELLRNKIVVAMDEEEMQLALTFLIEYDNLHVSNIIDRIKKNSDRALAIEEYNNNLILTHK